MRRLIVRPAIIRDNWLPSGGRCNLRAFPQITGQFKERFMQKKPAQTQAVSTITPKQLKELLHDGDEIAVLDVREEGVFAKRHLLLAASMPLSRLELRAPLLVPRRSTRVVICDSNEGLAQRAAGKLSGYGYTNVMVLAGGVDAWAVAGYEVYSGINVPSKAFGEFVEHHENTPRMPAQEIKAKVDAGEKVVILDSRPVPEYTKMSIPGGIDCPGAELVYRVHDLAPEPDTLVVVNCAGRTRSIIGAQSLINAGIPNRVVALKDGTMGWHLAGFELARQQKQYAPAPSTAGLTKARAAATRVAARFGVRYIDVDTVAKFAREADRRTLYLFDVRSPEEYAAGHLHSTVNAPGGQLVQTTDSFAATRNARIVLIDDHGVRATMTASWLIQMGWKDVFVVNNALESGPLYKGEAPLEVLGLVSVKSIFISPQELKCELDAGNAAVADFETSLRYRDAHIPGAWLSIRANLESNLQRIPPTKLLVLTSADGILAQLAAPEAAKLRNTPVKVLRGGTAAWRAAGLAMETGLTNLADTTDDVWYRPYDRTANVEEAMKDYLTWEVNLVKQIERDDDVNFRTFER
jgi:rhodanese-related sulfurtransferase